jgi:hypothetical protein
MSRDRRPRQRRVLGSSRIANSRGRQGRWRWKRLSLEPLEGRLLLAADYGDAPDTYGTLAASNGPYHEVAGWHLGAARDAESDGIPGALAVGDGADDDGVTFSPLRTGSAASIRVFVTQLPASNNPTLQLDAWIDFDGDGAFSGALERIATSLRVDRGEQVLSVHVPSWAAQGTTYARFRLSTTGMGLLSPGGNGGFGEVEDYAIDILPPNAGGGNFVEQLIINGNKGASTLFPLDIDRDGDLDLIANDQTAGRVAIHRNDGLGNFSQQLVTNFGTAKSIAVGDRNGDGLADLLVHSPTTASYWLQQGADGTFSVVSLSGGNAAVVADMMKDGRLDVLTATTTPSPFRILHNSSTSSVQNAATGTAPGTAVDAADIDRDGAVDFLGVTNDNAIAWFENVGGAPGYARHVISTEAANVLGASLVDLDGDGDLDVLAFDQEGAIAWFDNDGEQSFTRRVLATVAGVVQLNRADVDGDGDLDLLVAAGAAGAKLLTNDGAQTFTESTLPTSSAVGIQTVAAGDFDGDGILEIVAGGSHPNVNQPPGYLTILRQQPALDFGDAPASYGTTLAGGGPRHVSTGPTLGATRDSELEGGSPEAEDGDDDDGVIFGTLQVGATSAAAVVNVQNAPAGARLDAWIDFDGDGTFNGADERIAASRLVTEGDNVVTFTIPPGARAGATYARFRLSSVGGLGPLGGAADGEVEDYAVTIASAAGSGLFEANYHTGNVAATYAITVDFDGDGDVDVVTVGDSARWYRNDGSGNFSDANVSFSGYGSPTWFDIVDLDGDGDLDVVGTANGLLYWNENLGAMSFRLQQIRYGISGYSSPKLVDFDRDGDLDFVVAGTNEQGVRLVEQLEPGRFADRTLIAYTPGLYFGTPTAIAIAVADADGDGDLDVYLAPDEGNLRLVLYRNEGGNAFTRSDLVSGLHNSLRIQSLSPLDFDGDGDVDLALAVRNDWFSTPSQITAHTLGWYENLGNGEVALRIVSTALGDFRQMSVADVDGDGDFDFVASYFQFSRVVWHENRGGGSYAPRQLTINGSNFGGNYSKYFGAALGDLDGDGDLDVATTIWENSGLHWIEQLTAPTADYGDAPLPYPVGLSGGGPTHVAVGPRLGEDRDAEAGVDNSADANGDGADDDGVTFEPFRVGELGATVSVNVQNAPAGARLDAWIDFDGDGNWSRAEERIAANVAVVEGENVITFGVPTWAMAGTSYARFRVSTAGGLGYVGAAADGEVEDHAVVISPPAAAAGPYFERHAIGDHSFLQNPVLSVDLDSDGDYDVIAASYASPYLSWYENDGTGQFAARVLTGAYAGSYTDLGASDVDLDGDVDLVVRSWSGPNIMLLLNDGAQNFTQKPFYTQWSSTRNFAIVDVEGDGDLDYFDAGQLTLNLANGNQTVSTPYQFMRSPSFIADIDRDGTLDLLSGHTYGSSSVTSRIGYWRYLLGQIGQVTPLGNLQIYPNAMSAADLDQDGDLDLVIVLPSGGDNLRWLENDGALNFTERSLGATALVSQLSTADLDGDGDLDLLASDTSFAYWFENDGSENFTRHFVAASTGPHSLADIDGDGALDVVLYDRTFNGQPGGLAWYSLTDRQLSIAVAPAAVDEEASDSIIFTFTREGNVEEEATISFTVGGEARFGVDYTVSGAASFGATEGSVTFPAGVSTVEVTLTPIDDETKELHERVTLGIPPTPGYSLANAIATATIRSAELAGDYDDNNVVDGADFLAWQRSFGRAADPIGSDADGNLDGEVDGDDLTVWTKNFGQTSVAPPPVAVVAMFVESEAVSSVAAAATPDEPAPAGRLTPWYGPAAGSRSPIVLRSSDAASVSDERRQRSLTVEGVADEWFARSAGWSHRRDLEFWLASRSGSWTDVSAVDVAFGDDQDESAAEDLSHSPMRLAGEFEPVQSIL